MTPMLPILMAKIAVLLVLDIRLPVSSRISMQNRVVSDGWIRFEQCYADVLYLSVSIENNSLTSKAPVGDNGSTLCSMVIPILTCFQLFATSGFVNEIVTITQTIFTLPFMMPRKVSELKIIHCKERTGIIFC